MAANISDIERRIRAVEERFSNLERRSQVTEENMLSSDRKIRADIKITASEIAEIKAQLAEIAESVHKLAKSMQTFARQEDVEILKKYLNLIEPLGFVTQNEVERLIEDKIQEILAKQE